MKLGHLAFLFPLIALSQCAHAQQAHVRTRIGQGVQGSPSISSDLKTIVSTLVSADQQIPERVVVSHAPRYAPDSILYSASTEFVQPTLCPDDKSFVCIRKTNSTDGRLERVTFNNKTVWSRPAPGSFVRVRQALSADVTALLKDTAVEFVRTSDGAALTTFNDPLFNLSTQCVISADGSIFVTGERVVKVMRRSDNQLIFSKNLDFRSLTALGLSWNGRFVGVVSQYYDGNNVSHYELSIRDTVSGTDLPTPAWKPVLDSVSFKPDGTEYLVGTVSGIDIVSTNSGLKQKTLSLPRLPTSARAQWSADGQKILILEQSRGETECWTYSATTGQLLDRGSMDLSAFEFERNTHVGLCRLGDRYASVEPLSGQVLTFYGGSTKTPLGFGCGSNRTLITAASPTPDKVDYRTYDIATGALIGQSQTANQGQAYDFLKIRPGTSHASMIRLFSDTFDLVIADTATGALISSFNTGGRLFTTSNWSKDGRFWRHTDSTGAYYLDYGGTGTVTEIAGNFGTGDGAWSPDGRSYAYFSRDSGADRLIVRNVNDMALLNTWALPNSAEYGKHLVYSADSKTIWAVVGAFSWPLRLVAINAATGFCFWSDRFPDTVEDCVALSVSDDNRFLSILSEEGFVTIIQLPTLAGRAG